MTYREHTDQHVHYLDVWEWDIIIYPDGTVRVMGVSSECAIHQEDSYQYGRCDCPVERPRMSSPVVEHGVLLKEAWRDEEQGVARHLLTARAGTEISVLSGKTYRLCGPRVPQDSVAGGSISDFYRAQDEVARKLTLWERVREWFAA